MTFAPTELGLSVAEVSFRYYFVLQSSFLMGELQLELPRIMMLLNIKVVYYTGSLFCYEGEF